MPEPDEPIDVSKLPISPIRTVGGFHLLGGVVGLATNTELVQGGLEAELNQIFKLIKLLLLQQNCDLRSICKTVVYIVKVKEDEEEEDFAVLNKIYHEIFGENAEFPARTTVWVKSNPKDARVQIEAIAVAKPDKSGITEEHLKSAREDRRSRR